MIDSLEKGQVPLQLNELYVHPIKITFHDKLYGFEAHWLSDTSVTLTVLNEEQQCIRAKVCYHPTNHQLKDYQVYGIPFHWDNICVYQAIYRHNLISICVSTNVVYVLKHVKVI